MNQRERLDELEKLLDELVMENERLPVVVEGEKDTRALRDLGLRGDIQQVNIGVSVFNLCEILARRHEKVIILTDWDRTGGRLARQLSEGLEANSAGYDLEFRKRLAWLVKKEIKDVEGLPGYLSRLREEVNR